MGRHLITPIREVQEVFHRCGPAFLKYTRFNVAVFTVVLLLFSATQAVSGDQLDDLHLTSHERRFVLPFEISLQRIETGVRRHFIERCSAFLINKDEHSAILLSAWHCIDGELSLQKSPTVSILGQTVSVRIVRSGGNMANDWLVMTAPADAFADITPIRISSQPASAAESLIGIGWGGISTGGQSEQRSLICPGSSVEKIITLNCGLKKGDSGGLVARPLPGGELEAIGIISSGDSSSISLAFALAHLPSDSH